MPVRIALIALTASMMLAGGLILPGSAADESAGYRFTLTISSQGIDPVVLDGAVLGDKVLLRGDVQGIETKYLLTQDCLYILTPAIHSATEVENIDPPSRNSGDWSEWLLEPGRVNPLTFAGMIGEDSDKDGSVDFGRDGAVEAVFDTGRLTRLSFPSPSDETSIVYSYTDFMEDPDLSASDFEVPEGYH